MSDNVMRANENVRRRAAYVPEFLNPLLISDDQPIMKTEARMRILERAAHVNMT
ncbi:hypothetical protein PHYSODRAFT_326458 [Phytophthora sojae]|uniref:Uncharacterized protein n=1 Tax=Phytophthora sojae (strain P6497) TaxID=1094619 RepID=G4YTX7_PHYSP|nr:hypothetical protein PHYSODRAFT_326458 [Phytophthora sojae]EGZ25448.1 hypothetical protein PHYSODRAFT_326458 [Phytophthora sojae]|eukprot:XP_009520736.1 hypothetical protein PHYSODRAFT_326458 [Phytophthora sojae]